MIDKDRKGIKVNLVCNRCGKDFLRPANTIRPEQKGLYCSRECLKKTPEEKLATMRKCRNDYNAKNREKVRERAKELRHKNVERTRELRRQSYHRHKKEIMERAKLDRKNNPDKFRKRGIQYYKDNKERLKAYAKKFRQENPDYLKQQRKNHWEKNRHCVLWSSAKKSAKVQNVKFDLTKEWIKQRLDFGICEMTGLLFDMEGKRTKDTPSIDRIKPGGNYTMNNCRMILWSLNHALCNYGEEYIFKIFKAALNKRKSTA